MGLENEAIQLNGTAGQSTLEGGHEKLQATVRKILEMVDAQEEAMPQCRPRVFWSSLKAPLLCHDFQEALFSIDSGLTMRDACSLEHTDNIGLFGRRCCILQPAMYALG